MNLITNPSSTFSTIKMIIFIMMPKLGKLLNLSFFDQSAMDFIAEMVKQSLELRKKDSSLKRNDLIDVLIETLKDHGVSHQYFNTSEYLSRYTMSYS